MTALVKAEPAAAVALRGLRIETMSDLSNFGAMLAKSGYFKDAREAAQACVKVQAGLELGIPPVQAMTGIFIVEGKPALSAALIATLIKRSGRYTYRIVAHDEAHCVLAFFEVGEKVGESSFTMKDAEKAGLAGKSVWKSYARNMLFARAMSNGARWFCPDVFGGSVYTPEEMGVPVNGEGDPIVVVETPPPGVKTEPPPKALPALSSKALKSAQDAAWAEMDRLLIGNDLDADAQKDMRRSAITRLCGRMPSTVAEWTAAVELLKSEPDPQIEDLEREQREMADESRNGDAR
jgi:hypothetical protein